jgi:hypothetical protein
MFLYSTKTLTLRFTRLSFPAFLVPLFAFLCLVLALSCVAAVSRLVLSCLRLSFFFLYCQQDHRMASILVNCREVDPGDTGLFLRMLDSEEWESQPSHFSKVSADSNEALSFLLYGVDGNLR